MVDGAKGCAIPPLTRRIKFILRGTRISGGDNDSYFDNLFLRLVEAGGMSRLFWFIRYR
ncbi:MAG: hypothetical protein IPG18_04690 [Saprospiraceae bacterium]|nr:hypothetical protein [Saprospiraceae bacterium]